MTTKRKEYQQALADLMSCRPIAYWPSLARKVGGVTTAVMLSQLLYWNGDTTVQKRDGWFWKKIDEMELETGLTPDQQSTARRDLAGLGVVETAWRGMPPVWHYRVDMDRLGEIILQSPFTGKTGKRSPEKPVNVHRDYRGRFTGKTGKGSAAKPVNIHREDRQTFTDKPGEVNESETTSETTNIDYPETSSSRKEEEAMAEILLSPLVVSRLESIGLFKDKFGEVAALATSAGINDNALLRMIADARQREPEVGKTAALLLYRLRNLPAGITVNPDDADRIQRASYAVPGVTQ